VRHAGVRRAAAAVELALVTPLLLLLFVVAVDFARVFYFTQILSQCARNGAMHACDPEGAKDSRYASVEEAAKADAPAFLRDSLSVSTQYGTATWSEKDPDGNEKKITYDYVTVTVTYQFSLISDYPLLPGDQIFARSVRMRMIPAVPD
jgi:Flp pilus assembly protein TadG